MKTTLTNAPYYTWGNHCEAWKLLDSEGLSVIQEKMPPNTAEQLHYHNEAQQFFFILKGCAFFEIADATIEVGTGEGIRIEAKTVHRILNKSEDYLEFLVISQPTTKHGDRVNVST